MERGNGWSGMDDEPGDWCGEDPELWRGDVHADESWPEYLAGPEYWLNKQQADGDEDGA